MTVVAEPTVLAAALTVLGLDFLKSKFNLVADSSVSAAHKRSLGHYVSTVLDLDFLISKVDL